MLLHHCLLNAETVSKHPTRVPDWRRTGCQFPVASLGTFPSAGYAFRPFRFRDWLAIALRMKSSR